MSPVHSNSPNNYQIGRGNTTIVANLESCLQESSILLGSSTPYFIACLPDYESGKQASHIYLTLQLVF